MFLNRNKEELQEFLFPRFVEGKWICYLLWLLWSPVALLLFLAVVGYYLHEISPWGRRAFRIKKFSRLMWRDDREQPVPGVRRQTMVHALYGLSSHSSKARRVEYENWLERNRNNIVTEEERLSGVQTREVKIDPESFS